MSSAPPFLRGVEQVAQRERQRSLPPPDQRNVWMGVIAVVIGLALFGLGALYGAIIPDGWFKWLMFAVLAVAAGVGLYVGATQLAYGYQCQKTWRETPLQV